MAESNWFNQIILLGALQGFILGIVVLKKAENRKTIAILLSTLLFLTSFTLIGRVFFLTEVLNRFWWVYTYADVIIFLFGPVIYFFTHTLTGKQLPAWKRLRWHFLPVMLHLFGFNTIIALAYAGLISFVTNAHLSLMYTMLEFAAIISLCIYLWKSIELFHRFEKEYEHNFSYPAVVSFLKPFLYFFSFLSIVWGLAFFLRFTDTKTGDEAFVYYGFWTLVAVSTYLMSYKILLRPEIFRARPENTSDVSIKKKKEINQELQQLKDQLEQYLLSSKIYQNPKLSLDELALSMQVNRHELSKTINQGFGKNFFDLINSFRVASFIRVYEAGENLTFLEVAYEVGFNSKSAFNRAFRKEKNCSPSEYFKKQVRLQNA